MDFGLALSSATLQLIYLFFSLSPVLFLCICPFLFLTYLLLTSLPISSCSSSFQTPWFCSLSTGANAVHFSVLELGLSICWQMDTAYETTNLGSSLFPYWTQSLFHKSRRMGEFQFSSISGLCLYLFWVLLLYFWRYFYWILSLSISASIFRIRSHSSCCVIHLLHAICYWLNYSFILDSF